MRMLRVLAKATNAPYVPSTDIPNAKSRAPIFPNNPDKPSEETTTSSEPNGLLSTLRATLRQVDEIAQNTHEASKSLEVAANKWRLNRKKLSRATTVRC